MPDSNYVGPPKKHRVHLMHKTDKNIDQRIDQHFTNTFGPGHQQVQYLLKNDKS